MNPSNLRPFPAPSKAIDSVASRSAAEREMEGFWNTLLARGASAEESPDYELLEAAVDGRLDPIEEELFASRIAGDAGLEREFADLVALRQRLTNPSAPWQSAAGRKPVRQWLGLAAAAVLLAAVGLGVRHNLERQAGSGSRMPGDQMTPVVAPAPHPGQPLFADSFEGGTTDRWSN